MNRYLIKISRSSLLPSVCAMLLLQACGGGGDAAPAPSTTSPVQPPPPAVNPAPSGLQATWITVLKDGSNQQVTLRLTENGYRINRGADEATGSIEVVGGRIDFKRSSLCPGTGSYQWTLTGNSLFFASSGTTGDPCPGRSEVLDGYTYIKR